MELWITLGITALIAVILVMIYNKLVVLKNTYQNALKQIDVVLKQRHDMIPAMVATVKGYADHEKETFALIVEARNKAEEARTSLSKVPTSDEVATLAATEAQLTKGIGQFFALAEAYPDLKASQNFVELQDDIARLEDKIAAARRGYNMTVLEYNNGIEKFPSNLMAGAMSLSRASELDFSDEPDIKNMPDISF
jgi:LemA protein